MKVYYNDELISIKTFDDYIKMYYKNGYPSDLVYEEINDRWKVGVLYDTYSGHQQISFVNGISTFHGGTHVKYILDQIINGLIGVIKKKNKNINVKPQYIRENLTLFIDCIIEDPNFESQTKELLKKKVSDFGSKCEISDKFLQKVV
jgi:DNA topoisomerase-2